MATKNSASGTITHGLARNVPKALPSSAKIVPSVAEHDGDAGDVGRRQRQRAAAADARLAPKMLMVMGIIG